MSVCDNKPITKNSKTSLTKNGKRWNEIYELKKGHFQSNDIHLKKTIIQNNAVQEIRFKIWMITWKVVHIIYTYGLKSNYH